MLNAKVSPWVKGFKPPAKCSNCKRLYTLVFTGRRTQEGDHIYACESCGSLVGAPTDYGHCGYDNKDIEKDCFWNFCTKCPHRRVTENEPICVHFSLKKSYQETDVASAIEDSMRKVRKIKFPEA